MVQALVQHTFGTQGHEETFSEPVENDYMIQYFEKETNRANDTSNSIVLYMKKVLQNEDGSIKLDSKGGKMLESIYINADYAKDLALG